jgi:hypothetical protein
MTNIVHGNKSTVIVNDTTPALDKTFSSQHIENTFDKKPTEYSYVPGTKTYLRLATLTNISTNTVELDLTIKVTISHSNGVFGDVVLHVNKITGDPDLAASWNLFWGNDVIYDTTSSMDLQFGIVKIETSTYDVYVSPSTNIYNRIRKAEITNFTHGFYGESYLVRKDVTTTAPTFLKSVAFTPARLTNLKAPYPCNELITTMVPDAGTIYIPFGGVPDVTVSSNYLTNTVGKIILGRYGYGASSFFSCDWAILISYGSSSVPNMKISNILAATAGTVQVDLGHFYINDVGTASITQRYAGIKIYCSMQHTAEIFYCTVAANTADGSYLNKLLQPADISTFTKITGNT